MNAAPWNHNNHHHDVILRAVPTNCRRALDVGCGEGLLARRLARHCDEVVAIDLDPATLAQAIAAGGSGARILYRRGDVLTAALALESFDFITAVAALHHMPCVPRSSGSARSSNPAAFLRSSASIA